MNLFSDYHSKIEIFLKSLEKNKIIKLPEDLRSMTVELPPKNNKADLACNIAMILSKLNKKSPNDIALLLKEHFLKYFPEIKNIDVAKPGFLNITFTALFWKDHLYDVIKLKDKYGSNKINKKKYNIEFVSANPTGPLHVGHCRGAILGDVLSNLLIFNGCSVTKEYYVNDYGNQIKKFVNSVYYRILEIQNSKPFPTSEDLYPGDYIIDIAKKIIKNNSIKDFSNIDEIFEKLSSESLQISMNLIKNNLNQLGIRHDNFVYESQLIKNKVVFKTVEKLKKLNYVYTGKLSSPKGEKFSDWEPRDQLLFKSTQFGDDTDRALQKSDNSWTYFAGDVGYHADKIDRKFDILINILGADHAGYIKRIESAVKAISENKTNLLCKVSQLVKLFKNNKPFKMSKRKGDYITVEDLVNEVGKDSVRFMMLNRSNDVELDFDFKKVTEKSKDNPVFYVQYAYARINSVFRLLKLNIEEDVSLKGESFSINTHENEILKKISEWPKCIETTISKLEPHIIPYYLYELSTLFHSYWNMGNKNKELRFVIDNKIANRSRLQILQALSIVIANAMSILGVSTPKRM
ncbi:arginine--tRNA ligase [Pelagibacteraceae bacterium]|nr:arginine--tRNA ligase [Pelagibacteraceae bacterium]